MRHVEKFIDCANDKLNLMQSLDITERDQMDLLAEGIKLPMIRIAAVDTRFERVADFIEHLMRVTVAKVTIRGASQRQVESPRPIDSFTRQGFSETASVGTVRS